MFRTPPNHATNSTAQVALSVTPASPFGGSDISTTMNATHTMAMTFRSEQPEHDRQAEAMLESPCRGIAWSGKNLAAVETHAL